MSGAEPAGLTGIMEGEDSTQGFMRHQMINILQPITEEVQDLQAALELLRKDLNFANGRLDQHQKDLEEHDKEILANKTADKAMQERLNKMQVQAKSDQEELGRTQQDLQGTKAALSKMNEKAQHNKAKAELNESRVGDLLLAFNQMKKDLESVDVLLHGHIKGVNQLKDHHGDLHKRHNDQAEKLDEAAYVAGNTDRALNKFLKDHQHQCEEDSQILIGMKRHMNEFAALLDETREAVHQQGLGLMAANATLQTFGPKSGGVRGENMGDRFGQLERQQAEVVKDLQRTMDRVAQNFNSVTDLGDEFGAHKVATQSVLQDLGMKTMDNTDCISELARTVQRQGDVLNDTTERAYKVARDQKRLHEQQALTENDVVGLEGRYKKTTEALDGYKMEQQRTRADMLVLGREADSDLTQLRGDLGATSASLGKLTSRFGVCEHNVSGFGKGIQDVTKHTLKGEHNLLSPKSARNQLQPIRVSTPRGLPM